MYNLVYYKGLPKENCPIGNIITTEAECKLAFTHLVILFNERWGPPSHAPPGDITETNVPLGCFYNYYPGGHTHAGGFNTGKFNPNTDGDNDPAFFEVYAGVCKNTGK